jgi:hypothetical protein
MIQETGHLELRHGKHNYLFEIPFEPNTVEISYFPREHHHCGGIEFNEVEIKATNNIVNIVADIKTNSATVDWKAKIV